MTPTRLQVKTRFRALLDDANGDVFTNAIFTEAFGEAYDALFNAFVNYQCPRIQVITTYTLPANTTSVTPSAAGASNFADLDELEERLSGSTERYLPVLQREKLTQRDASDRLGEFVYRNDTLYFVGATTARQLRITYKTSSEAPTDDATTINVDGCLSFLAKYAVGVAGPLKGYDEEAARNMLSAVGPRYLDGKIGGELFMLVQHRVRSMQNVQIAPRPYRTGGYSRMHRAVPYIAAQASGSGGGGSTTLVEFSTAAGAAYSITGTMDGENSLFYLQFPVSGLDWLARNGSVLTAGVDYTWGTNQITMIAPQIPNSGDILTAKGLL